MVEDLGELEEAAGIGLADELVVSDEVICVRRLAGSTRSRRPRAAEPQAGGSGDDARGDRTLPDARGPYDDEEQRRG